MNQRFGSVVLVVLVSAAGAALAILPVRWQNPDYVPNPEVRAILERRGAWFDAAPAGAAQKPPVAELAGIGSSQDLLAEQSTAPSVTGRSGTALGR